MPVPTLLVGPYTVYTFDSGTEFDPSVAAGLDGRFGIHWQSSVVLSGQTDIYSYVYQGAAIGPNGLPGSVLSLGSYSNANDTTPDLEFLNSGNVVNAYVRNYDVYYDIWSKDAQGSYALTSVGQVVNQGATTGDQYRPEVLRLAGGGFVIAWQDNNDSTIKLNTYNSAGVKVGSTLSIPVSVDQAAGGFDFELTQWSEGASSGLIVGFRGAGGLTAAKAAVIEVDAVGAGTIAVSSFDVSTQAVGAAHGATATTQSSANGNLLSVWYDSDGGGVGFHLRNGNGVSLLAADGLIPGVGSAVGEFPRVAATLDGRFIVVFTGGGTGGVYGQMIAADGTLDGASFQISAETTSFRPDIERTADGRMIVSWQDGAGNISAAIYDPRTAALNLSGTSGVDNYVGSLFADVIVGFGGDDTIEGDFGNDILNGADGNDSLSGGDEDDVLIGGIGNDTLEGGFLADQLYGDDGDDAIYGMTSALPTSSGIADILIGGNGNDSMVGANGNDYFYGGADNDTMTGNGGIDVLIGEGGNDSMNGDAGNDYFYSGAGQNSMYGGADDDVFISEGSSDVLQGDGGHNYYYRYGTGGSTIYGGTGIDEFVGGTAVSNDNFGGGTGQDYAYGGNGVDQLYGAEDNDVLLGEGGDDFLDGEGGINALWGGAGNDTVFTYIGLGAQTQVLNDFTAGGVEDVVNIFDSTLTTFADVQSLIANLGVAQNGNLMYNTGTGAQLYMNLGANQAAIWFQGVSVYSLTASDFVFVQAPL